MPGKNKRFVCFNSRYMSYGFLSNYSICAQPPTACPHEAHETVRLQTGKILTIFYCTKMEETEPTKQKGGYIGLQRNGISQTVQTVQHEKQSVPSVLTEQPNACSLPGRR